MPSPKATALPAPNLRAEPERDFDFDLWREGERRRERERLREGERLFERERLREGERLFERERLRDGDFLRERERLREGARLREGDLRLLPEEVERPRFLSREESPELRRFFFAPAELSERPRFFPLDELFERRFEGEERRLEDDELLRPPMA
mmetsp:Transcript_86109/g.162281  ORF Transcript_86109/g.162281 Transcript_86109/m.162281 type:complete len:153 (+) Transcript_86109:287-745(+)